MRPRVSSWSIATGLACVVGVVAVFLWFHTGARAADLCARDGAAVPSGVSWWPPGARCSGGEPVRTTTTFDPVVGLAIPGIVLLAFGAAALIGTRRGAMDGAGKKVVDGKPVGGHK